MQLRLSDKPEEPVPCRLVTIEEGWVVCTIKDDDGKWFKVHLKPAEVHSIEERS